MIVICLKPSYAKFQTFIFTTFFYRGKKKCVENVFVPFLFLLNSIKKMIASYSTRNLVLSSPRDSKSVLTQGRRYADPGLFHPTQQPIELLIGRDFLYTFMYDTIQRLTGNLVLLQGHNGWIPAGSVEIESQVDQSLPALLGAVDLNPTKDKEPVHWELEELQEIGTLWSLEAMGIRKEELEVSEI